MKIRQEDITGIILVKHNNIDALDERQLNSFLLIQLYFVSSINKGKDVVLYCEYRNAWHMNWVS